MSMMLQIWHLWLNYMVVWSFTLVVLQNWIELLLLGHRQGWGSVMLFVNLTKKMCYKLQPNQQPKNSSKKILCLLWLLKHQMNVPLNNKLYFDIKIIRESLPVSSIISLSSFLIWLIVLRLERLVKHSSSWRSAK